MSRLSFQMGSEDYREGALLRIREARFLYDQHGSWIGAIYLSGRAVEALFRSLLWIRDRRQEIGHDLKDVLTRVQSLNILNEDERRLMSDLTDAVNELAILWRNDLRYTGEKRYRRFLEMNGRHRKIRGLKVKGDFLKANAKASLEAGEKIVACGEPICRKYRKSSNGN